MPKNTTILLVRHGEKPGDPGTDDKSDGPGLSPAGQARAQAYCEYFADFTASNVDGSKSRKVELQWVFATADNPGTSYRPRLTVSPFAEAALLPFSACVTDKHYADLVKQLYRDDTYDDSAVLICWHHGKIIDLADALLTNNEKTAKPALSPKSCWPPPHTWPAAVFGWLLQICFDRHGAVDVSWVRCFNERLMPDDTVDPCFLHATT
jgi:hypothetical protein